MNTTQQTREERKTGLNCPQCNTFIETSVFQLLTSHTLLCPHCRLRLSIDQTKSKKALEALRKVQIAQDNLEKKSKFNG